MQNSNDFACPRRQLQRMVLLCGRYRAQAVHSPQWSGRCWVKRGRRYDPDSSTNPTVEDGPRHVMKRFAVHEALPSSKNLEGKQYIT